MVASDIDETSMAGREGQRLKSSQVFSFSVYFISVSKVIETTTVCDIHTIGVIEMIELTVNSRTRAL